MRLAKSGLILSSLLGSLYGGELSKESLNFLNLKESSTTLTLGGRVELDTVYNDKSMGGVDGVNNKDDVDFSVKSIPLSGVGESGEMRMSSRASRLWVKSSTNSEYGKVKAYIEIDFLGSNANEKVSNSYNPRLRHAYVNGENFIIGQTTSTFGGVADAETVVSPVNITSARQPQIRYILKDKSSIYEFALESPETTLYDKDASFVTPSDDRVPDLIFRYLYYGIKSKLSFASMLREIRANKTLSDSGVDSEIGYGVNFSYRYNMLDFDNIRTSFTYGNAVGRYMSWNTFATGYIDESDNIELNRAFGTHFAYQHWFTPYTRSSFIYSYIEQDEVEELKNSSAISNAYSFQANIFTTFIKNSLVGVEYLRAKKELENGDSGDLNRVYLHFKYNF